MQFGDSEARPYPRSPAAKPSPALQEAMAPGTTAAVSTPFIPSFNFLAFNGSHMERQPTHRPLLQGPFLPGNIVIQASHLQSREGMEQCGARPQGLRAVFGISGSFPALLQPSVIWNQSRWARAGLGWHHVCLGHTRAVMVGR